MREIEEQWSIENNSRGSNGERERRRGQFFGQVEMVGSGLCVLLNTPSKPFKLSFI